MPKLFITFEGIEGAGKTTQAAALAKALEEHKLAVILTREPGGTAAGRQIRKICLDATIKLTALTELFLMLADRIQHLNEIIRPALAASEIVICDRYSDSTLSYQGYGRGLPLDLIRRLDMLAIQGLQPDLTFLLDCQVKTGLSRAGARRQVGALAGIKIDAKVSPSQIPALKTDRFESAPEDFHKRIREGLLDLAERESGRIVKINAERDPTTIGREILTHVMGRIGGSRKLQKGEQF